MIRFLNDAHLRGVVRQQGPIYQFRHARLQDWLAGEPTRTQVPELPVPDHAGSA